MSSSEGTSAAGETADTARSAAAELAAGTADFGQTAASADSDGSDDPWFTPGPKVAGYTAENGDNGANWTGNGAVSHGPGQAEWFLPTGRAGLLPDSMSVSHDEDALDPHLRAETAGAPPWAGDAEAVADSPPPWESGPWPGPGGERPATRRPPAAARERAAAPGSQLGAGPSAGLWAPRNMLVVGLVPLVIPGLVLGGLSLWRARGSGARQTASLVAVGASLVWAVIFIVIAGLGPGGPAASCGYPAAVHQAYAKVMADFSSQAPMQVQAADLANATSQANAAAAAAQQPTTRSALSAMAGDLEQARADATAQRAVPATLRQRLAADGTAVTSSCAS